MPVNETCISLAPFMSIHVKGRDLQALSLCSSEKLLPVGKVDGIAAALGRTEIEIDTQLDLIHRPLSVLNPRDTKLPSGLVHHLGSLTSGLAPKAIPVRWTQRETG